MASPHVAGVAALVKALISKSTAEFDVQKTQNIEKMRKDAQQVFQWKFVNCSSLELDGRNQR